MLATLIPVLGCSSENKDNDPWIITCGDEKTDPDETCDDANDAPSEGSGTLYGCTTLVEGSPDDEVEALWPLADGSFVAAGSFKDHGSRLAWIGRFSGAGERLWFAQPAPGDESPSSLIDIAPDAADGVWGLLAGLTSFELLHFDGAGALDARVDIGAAARVSLAARVIESVGSEVWIAGKSRQNLWLGRLDREAGTVETLLLEDHAGFDDDVWAIASNEAEVAIAATVNTSPSLDGDSILDPTSDVLLIRFDHQGNEVGRSLSSAGERLALRAHALLDDGEGSWIVGGVQYDARDLLGIEAAWIARLDPRPGWTWVDLGPLGHGAAFGDLVMIERDVVFAGGAYGVMALQQWLARVGSGGALVWQRSSESELAFNHATAVVRETTGNLRIAGKAWTPDESSVLRTCLVVP